MDDFSQAKVGQKLWCCTLGDVEVSSFTEERFIFVSSKRLYLTHHFLMKEGAYMVGGPQCLFWSEPMVIAPPKPKETKMIVLENVNWKHDFGTITYPLAGDFNFNWMSLWNKPPMKMTLEWEE